VTISSANPYIIAALLGERRGRFLAEAEHARRLRGLDQTRRVERAAFRRIKVLRSVMTGLIPVRSWGAKRRHHRLSMAGES
jgi:hypothetical protein